MSQELIVFVTGSIDASMRMRRCTVNSSENTLGITSEDLACKPFELALVTKSLCAGRSQNYKQRALLD